MFVTSQKPFIAKIEMKKQAIMIDFRWMEESVWMLPI